MPLSYEQVLQMAPDEASVSTAKKIQTPASWLRIGQNDQALWGEFQGSATYQVRFDYASAGYKCNCPSRKFPCKHVLGLLFLAAIHPASLPTQATPAWVAEWLAQRQATAAKKSTKAKDSPVDEKAQQKRAEQRQDRVHEGIVTLERWLNDLIRQGLAGLESQGSAIWEEQARRLVDAQAPGLALQLRRMGELPGSSPAWPSLLFQQLGRMKLALHAFHRIDQLDPALASSLRQWIGWTTSSEELEKHGERIVDDWQILGQWIEEDDRLRTQRTWCEGKTSRRQALVLQFVAGAGSFPLHLRAGTIQQGTMLFYPGSSPQRAQFIQRAETILPLTAIQGHTSVDSYLGQVARQVASQPWLHSFLAVLQQVTLATKSKHWYARDLSGMSLPLCEFDVWKLLALTGSDPFDLIAEWNGHQLRPLGAIVEGGYQPLP